MIVSVPEVTASVKNFGFNVPMGVDWKVILGAPLKHRLDEALQFVSTVVRKTRQGKVDRLGYARLHRKVLRRTLSERTLSAIEDRLVVTGILERAGHRRGWYSTGFRLALPWRSQPLQRIAATDERLIDRMHREFARLEQRRLARLLPVHCEIDRVQRELLTIGIQADGLAAVITDPGTRTRMTTLVKQIRAGRSGKRSFTGRWFSPFCGLARGFRPMVHLDGEPIGGFDLRCAQPSLLAVFLGSQFADVAQCVGAYSSECSSCDRVASVVTGRVSDTCDSCDVLSFDFLRSVALGVPRCGPDLGIFTDLTRNAVFYDHLLHLARAAGVDLRDPTCKGRSELGMVKRLLLQDVLAKRGHYPSDFERVFREAFPTVHEAVRWVNSRHSPPDGRGQDRVHGKLICILQRLESALALETVCPSLLERIPVLPLHDCLFTRLSDIALVEEAFEETFARCGVRVKLKRDVPCEQCACN